MNTRLLQLICLLRSFFNKSQENEVTSSADVACTSKEEESVPSAPSEVAVIVQSVTSNEEPDSTTETVHVSQTSSGTDDKPVDLSSKKSDSDCSESTQGKVRICSGFFCKDGSMPFCRLV